jgi:hypothetical protein
MARIPDPKSKAGFVRSLPESTPAAEVVAQAKAKGLAMDARYVYSVRTAARAKATGPKSGEGASTTAKRGPDRPRGSSNGARSSGRAAGGLEAVIEAIVERKVQEILKARLGALFR